MNIQEALKETGKAFHVTYSDLYVTWISGNVCFVTVYGNEDRPLEHHELLKDGWQHYHEVKEIRPENAGELWEMAGHAKFFVITDERTGKNELCGIYGNKIVIRKDMIHGKDWTRLFPPVEDDSIERIEIEGVRWFQEHNGEIYPVADTSICFKNPFSYLLHKPLMKMILLIPKDKP